MNKMLVIIRGLPGSGKSTLAAKLNEDAIENGIVSEHYENDMFHIVDGEYTWTVERAKDGVEWCFNAVLDAMERGVDQIIVSNVFPNRKTLRWYTSTALGLGYDFQVIEMKENYGNIHRVPVEAVDSMRKNWWELDEDYLRGTAEEPEVEV